MSVQRVITDPSRGTLQRGLIVDKIEADSRFARHDLGQNRTIHLRSVEGGLA